MSKRVEAATRAAKLKVEMKYLDQETNLFIYLFIYLFNSFIGYVYKLKMNTYTRKETKNG